MEYYSRWDRALSCSYMHARLYLHPAQLSVLDESVDD